MAEPSYPPERDLDERHGTHDPLDASSTPDRVRGSIRRTESIDMVRPDGIRRDLLLRGRARDLLTRADGSVDVVDEATIDVVVDYLDAVSVTRLDTTPEVDALHQVLGRAAATGFRAAVDEAIDLDVWKGRPVYQLLDDIPVATLVSGYAVGFKGALTQTDEQDERPWRRAEGMAELQVADLCAGFQAGGTIMTQRAEGKPGGVHVTGPITPAVERADDPWSFHPLEAMAPDGMRRRRRIDVWRVDGESARVACDAHFRDSHLGDDGYETTIHEYLVRGTVDLDANVFVEAEALPQVLPWWECPQAAASAGRLAGMSLTALRPAVRYGFLGPTTCTHLNDTMRALEDLPTLAASLA